MTAAPLLPCPTCPGCYCVHGLDILPGYSPHYIRLADMVIGQCGKFYRPKVSRSLSSSWLALLLSMSGVEANPWPSFSFEFLNSCSIVNEGPLIINLMDTHQLDILAVYETWIVNLPAVTLDSAPTGYQVPNQQYCKYSSFECILVKINESGSTHSTNNVTVAAISRPPTSSMWRQFYDDLSDMFIRIGGDMDNDCFVACGDFNCSEIAQLVQLLQLPVYVISSSTALIPGVFSRLLYDRHTGCRSMTWSSESLLPERSLLNVCRHTAFIAWKTSAGRSSNLTSTALH